MQICKENEQAYWSMLAHQHLQYLAMLHTIWFYIKWKKRSEETQTLHTGCSKAEPKFFAPLQTPFPGARDGQI